MITKSIGPYINILSGFAFKSEMFNTERRGMPLVRIRDVKPGVTDTYYDGPYEEKYVVRKGDLLVGMDGEFNCNRWSGDDALLNQRVCRIVSTSPEIDEQYLFWFLPSALKTLEERSNFVTVKHLSSGQIRDITLPLPPPFEQKHIVAILDRADALRHKRLNSLDRLESLRKSIFAHLFVETDNADNWPVKTVGEIAITHPLALGLEL